VTLAQIPAREDRSQIRTFATWQLHHDLARRERQGQTNRSSAKTHVGYMRAAASLARWANACGLTLA
jgi:hypothetical protein